MDILQIIENETSYTYKKKSSTHGGEFSGPCPWCNGNDRFSIHPLNDHYVCRRCKKAGDSIQFFRDYHSQTYFQACASIGIQPQINYNSLDTSKEKLNENQIVWSPRETEIPINKWQTKATALLFEFYKNLLSSKGKLQREYLNGRGLLNKTIKTARLGYNPSSMSFSRESWGLSSDSDSKIWIPQGIVIPDFKNNQVVRLRVRQEKPVSKNKYIVISGSYTGYFNYDKFLNETNNPDFPLNKPVFICEAELDGWLAYQEFKQSFSVFAIGNSSARPDIETDSIIKNKKIILNLDNDLAGKEEVSWWEKHYPNSAPIFTGKGKDLSESFEKGADLQEFEKEALAISGIIVTEESPKKALEESFFDKIITENQKKETKRIKKEPIIQKIEQEQPQEWGAGLCRHGRYCNHLKDNLCLIDRDNIFIRNKTCPREFWYEYSEGSGLISEIILGVGFKK